METQRQSQHVRHQHSLLSSIEKRILIWIAKRLPLWLNSDHLTLLGFLAMLGIGLSYWASVWDRRALILAIFGLAVNWFGDSLDGTLARVRRQQRPRYGFYVDHVVDIVGSSKKKGHELPPARQLPSGRVGFIRLHESPHRTRLADRIPYGVRRALSCHSRARSLQTFFYGNGSDRAAYPAGGRNPFPFLQTCSPAGKSGKFQSTRCRGRLRHRRHGGDPDRLVNPKCTLSLPG